MVPDEAVTVAVAVAVSLDGVMVPMKDAQRAGVRRGRRGIGRQAVRRCRSTMPKGSGSTRCPSRACASRRRRR